MTYAWIAKNKFAWPVTMMCEVLCVSTSGYFEHQRRRQTSQTSRPGGGRISNEALVAHIRAIHAEVKGEYGWTRKWTTSNKGKVTYGFMSMATSHDRRLFAINWSEAELDAQLLSWPPANSPDCAPWPNCARRWRNE